MVMFLSCIYNAIFVIKFKLYKFKINGKNWNFLWLVNRQY